MYIISINGVYNLYESGMSDKTWQLVEDCYIGLGWAAFIADELD